MGKVSLRSSPVDSYRGSDDRLLPNDVILQTRLTNIREQRTISFKAPHSETLELSHPKRLS